MPWALYRELGKKLHFSLDTPVREMPKELLDKIYAGEIQDGKTVAGILAFSSLKNWKGSIE